MILLKGMAKPSAFETARGQQPQSSGVGPQSEYLVDIVPDTLYMTIPDFRRILIHENGCICTCSMKGCTNYYDPNPSDRLGQPV